MAGGGGDMSEQQQQQQECGDGTSHRPALHIALTSQTDKEPQEPEQVLPSPVNTDTGESDVSRMTRSLTDIVGSNDGGGNGGGGSCNDDDDESYRIAITGVLERLRAKGGSNDNGIGNSYTPVRRRSSSDLWSRRRERGHGNEARDSKSVCSQEQQSDTNYFCPDNAATSLSSSASSSSSFERPQQRQRMKLPPKPTTGPTCTSSSAIGSGLPPAAPARRRRRAPTPSSSCTSIGGSNRPSIDSGTAVGLLPPPSKLTRGVSIFEMKRRPSASMTPEDLDAINSTTASPIAFFQDAADDNEEGYGGKGALAPSLQPPISIPTTPLTKIPYVHGAYSAVAPIFIRDARWMAILRKLMPESHAGVATLLKKSARAPSKIDPLRLMKWAENNPVVAAYGTLNSDAGQRSHVDSREGNRNSDDGNGAAAAQAKPAALEWDVFLDPSLVRSVDKAMQAVEDLDEAGKLDDASSFDDLNARIAADVEVDRQMSRLMSRMMLAHGSTTQLVTEAVGMASRYNFSRVVEQGESRRRKSRWTMDGSTLPECGCLGSDPQIAHAMSEESSTLSPSKAYEADAKKAGKGSKTIAASGIFAERWLVLYAKALKLGLDNAYKADKGGFASKHFTSSLQTDSTYSLRRGLSEGSFSSSSLLESDDEEEEDDDDAADNKSIDSFVVEADENIADRLSMCGLLLCLGMEDPNARKADHSRSTMARSAKRINELLRAPLRVVLDLKSRKVPPRVWARLLDNLRTRGIGVNGIGSLDIYELRSIGSLCCTPVSKVIFLHSAGDLQRACHAQEIKRGDTVFFNAGSLIWKRPTLCEATGFGMCTSADANVLNETRNTCTPDNEPKDNFDPWNQNGLVLGGYSFQPYAYPREKLELLDGVVEECRATLEDYQRHLELNIGLYVQEFSIGDGALDAVAKLINHYPSIYNLGLAWGGINGATVKGVHGDGYWNQRYIGREWDRTAEPAEQMTLLAPEDHHLFQKAMHAGDWGQALTVNQIGIDDGGGRGLQRLHVHAMCKTPMNK
mmetsp:Transcript_15330/g.33339  ORF Transcript_15330/g.33339 Transcript_15330/m.33339 type:complete len:1023 (-) Transcript_15330:1622-4690(-)